MPEVSELGIFNDRVTNLLDELSLGIQWERSSLILAVYRSEYIKNWINATLTKSLGELGQAVLYYSIDKYHYDIPTELRHHPKKQHTVYIISGLRWGGGRGYSNAYRALNMHREYLIDGNIRAIFWLTVKEAKKLSRFSPDFWAFRHKVIEFLDLPGKGNIQPNGIVIGSSLNLYTEDAKDFQILIHTAEDLVRIGCMEEAILNYQKALKNYPKQAAIQLKIAEVHLWMERVTAAKQNLRKVNKENPDNIFIIDELNRLNFVVASTEQKQGGLLN